MRAIPFLATVAVSAVVAFAGPGIAVAQEAPPPVPGPQRPIADPPPVDPTATDKRRPRPATPVAPAPPLATPTPPPTLPPTAVLEGAFRPGAPGEKAAGRAIARLATHELRLEKLAVTPGRDL
jgi:hypothetical protein